MRHLYWGIDLHIWQIFWMECFKDCEFWQEPLFRFFFQYFIYNLCLRWDGMILISNIMFIYYIHAVIQFTVYIIFSITLPIFTHCLIFRNNENVVRWKGQTSKDWTSTLVLQTISFFLSCSTETLEGHLLLLYIWSLLKTNLSICEIKQRPEVVLYQVGVSLIQHTIFVQVHRNEDHSPFAL